MGYTNEFNLEIGTTLNTTNIPKKLKELNAELQKSTSVKIPVTVTVNEKSGLTAIKNIYKEVNTYKDKIGNTYKQIRELDSGGNVLSDKLVKTSSSLQTLTTETHKFTNTKGEINSWTTSIDNLGKTVQTRVKQYVNDSKELVTETSEWGRNAKGQWEQLGNTIQKSQEIVKESTTSTNTVKGQIDDLGKSYQGLITTTEKFSSNGEYLKTVISKYTDEMGRAIVKTEQFDKTGKQVATTMRQIGEATQISNTKKATFIDKEGNQIITEYKDGVAVLRTEIKKYTDDVGNLVVQTDKYDAQTNKLISTHQDLKRNVEAEVKEDNKRLEQLNNLITKINEQTEAQERLKKALVSTTTKQSRGTTTQFGDKSGQEYEALITTIERIDKEGQKTIQTIYEFTNAQGQLVKQTRTTDEYLNKIAEDTIEVSQALEKVTKATNDVSSIHKYVDSIGRLVTETVSFNEQGEKIVKTVIEEQKGIGQLTTTTKVLNETTGQLISTNIQLVNDETKVDKTLNNTSNSVKKTSDNLKELNTTTERANHGVKNLGWTLSDAISRLANFYIASLPIRAVQTAITETIQTVKDFDSALIEFRKVSDLAGDSLSDYVAKLAEMGEVTGSTMQAMVEAATQFRKSGFSDDDSAQLASIAEKYRNIADEEISAGESASFIIAQMKAFNIEAGQAEHIIDSVNEVANNFSVSSADLAKNLGNMSEIMAINNVSMEQQIGMLTGVTEITRNASSASRGLVMISSRLTQVLDDSSSTGKKLTKIYNELGIELKDENGQLRSHYDILGDLAKQWNNLSENQQKYIALTSAGARQQQNFVALMENWGQVANATTTAYESMGSAQRENEKVMDSIAKKVEILKSEFQQLVIGKGGLQDFAKTILNIGIALLKFANSDIGKVIIKLTLLITTFNLLTKVTASKFIIDLIGSFKQFTMTLIASAKGLMEFALANGIATTTTGAFTFAIKELTVAMLSNPIFAFTTALIALGGAIIYAKQKADEYNENVSSAREEVIKLKDEIKELEKAERSEAGLTQAERDRLDYLQKRLELTEKIANRPLLGEVAKSDYDYEATNLVTETGVVEYSATPKRNLSFAPTNEDITAYNKLNEEIKNWTNNTKEGMELLEEKYNQSQTILNSLEAERDELGKLRDEYSQNAREYELLTGKKEQGIKLSDEEKNRLNELEDASKSLSIEEQSRLATLEANIGEYKKNIKEIKTYQEAVDEYGDASEEADSILQEFAKSLGISETQLISNANALGLSIDAYYEYARAVKANDEAIDSFQSSLGTLQSAVEEYNESQYLSLDTIQSLLNLQPEYLNMLVEENGQLKLNEDAIVDKCNALIEERKQTALQMAYDRLAAIERGENAQAANVQSASIDGNTDSLNTETAALSKNTVEQYANRIARNDKAKGTAASQVIRDLEKELSILEKVGNSYTKISGSAKKAGKAGSSGAKSATNAQKDLNKELQETLNKYKKVISWIGKQYDKEIDKIKEAKDAAVDAEEEKIKALEKEKDYATGAIEKRIKALEKEKKLLEEQKDLLNERKDALEEQKDAITDSVEEDINKLKDLKEARQDYWDAQIDALKKANQELKDNLELQEKLDALEKAKNTKVKIYKEGQGFVYDVDQTEVAKAQKALDEYLSQKAYEDELERLENLKDAELKNYEDRINALEKYKDNVEKIYDAKIKVIEKDIDALEKQMDEFDKHKDSLEEHKNAVEEAYQAEIDLLNERKEALEEEYDAEIKMYEDYKQQFEDMVNAYEEQQNRLLAEQLTGISFENNNWMTRLDNLANFVNEYNKLQAQLDTGNGSGGSGSGSADTGGSSGGSGSGSTTLDTSSVNTTTTSSTKGVKEVTIGYAGDSSVGSSGKITKKVAYVGDSSVGKSGVVEIKSHASGTPSVKSDEIAIVGENPNKEIVIGSKINNGELMSLGKGTGVVNADSSKTLASMLNQVGQFGSSGFGSGNGTLNNNINNDSLVVNGVTIQGSNIKDPETFVNGLLSLKSEALQRAYKHR